LKDANDHLRTALAGHERGQELRAEELRLASDRLGRITGAVDVEDMLDVIFSQFCIGK
ncbi:tRNA uridine-5-carboxymethylaminomethyl(34) synthesis GTPase MnmE, partial [Mesorhizobium sp. M2D.F.Ca.ET.178.01.1.1]